MVVTTNNIKNDFAEVLDIEENFNVTYSSGYNPEINIYRKAENGDSIVSDWVKIRSVMSVPNIFTLNGSFINPNDNQFAWRYEFIGKALENWDSFCKIVHKIHESNI